MAETANVSIISPRRQTSPPSEHQKVKLHLVKCGHLLEAQILSNTLIRNRRQECHQDDAGDYFSDRKLCPLAVLSSQHPALIISSASQDNRYRLRREFSQINPLPVTVLITGKQANPPLLQLRTPAVEGDGGDEASCYWDKNEYRLCERDRV